MLVQLPSILQLVMVQLVVKGVPLSVTNLQGGSGYSNPAFILVRLDQSSGIGTGTSAKITIGPSGNVTSVAIQTGGFRYAVGDTLTLNDASVIGGRVGGSNFTIDVGEVETRLISHCKKHRRYSSSLVVLFFQITSLTKVQLDTQQTLVLQ